MNMNIFNLLSSPILERPAGRHHLVLVLDVNLDLDVDRDAEASV